MRNTHLLYCYSQLDRRVRPLVVGVKKWARDCEINDASHNTLSSYALTLMVVFFLQAGVSPPVLPCLQVGLVHLDVEDCSEELLRQQSYGIKNQLVASNTPLLGALKRKIPQLGGILLAPRWFFMA